MANIIVFFNGQRGASTIDYLVKNKVEISGAFFPIGKENSPFIKQVNRHPFPVQSVGDVNHSDFLAVLEQMKPDIIVVAGYSSIFKPQILSLPKKGVLNLHAGRLPYYQGGSPLNWQIINGEKEIGISVLRMDEGIDTGNIMREALFPLHEEDTIKDAHETTNKLFPGLVSEAINDLLNNQKGIPQSNDNAIYWHQRNDDDGFIDWTTIESKDALNLIRALSTPYPGAFSYYNGIKVRLHAAQKASMKIRGVPGRIAYIQNAGPYVICKDQAILLTEYQGENQPSEWRLKHGQRFNLIRKQNDN